MDRTGHEPVISSAFNEAANKKAKRPHKPKRKGTRRSDVAPVTLRLTADERERLEELAVGMTLSAYIRMCVFSEEEKRRKRRPKNTVADKKALAECLALLGHSRMASNLSQLAYQANVGALVVDDEVKTQISESHDAIQEMRALGLNRLNGSMAACLTGTMFCRWNGRIWTTLLAPPRWIGPTLTPLTQVWEQMWERYEIERAQGGNGRGWASRRWARAVLVCEAHIGAIMGAQISGSGPTP